MKIWQSKKEFTTWLVILMISVSVGFYVQYLTWAELTSIAVAIYLLFNFYICVELVKIGKKLK